MTFQSSQRDAGTASSPIFLVQPPIRNVIAFRVVSLCVPWLIPAAPDPNPYYVVASSALAPMAANQQYVNGHLSDAIITFVNRNVVGRNHVFVDYAADWHSSHSGKHCDLSQIDFGLRYPNMAHLTTLVDWSIEIQLKYISDKRDTFVQ